MLSDALFEAINTIEYYQENYPEIYEEDKKEIKRIKDRMRKLMSKYDSGEMVANQTLNIPLKLKTPLVAAVLKKVRGYLIKYKKVEPVVHIRDYSNAILSEERMSGSSPPPRVKEIFDEFNIELYKLAEKFSIEVLQLEVALSETDA